jgi:carboxylesterase type B
MMPCLSNGTKLVALLSALGGVWAGTVTTTNGTIQGGTCDTSDANAFLGVPYALPPVGNLRLAAPELYNKKYDGVLKATAQPPSCPQFGLAYVEEGKQSEDWYACSWQASKPASY